VGEAWQAIKGEIVGQRIADATDQHADQSDNENFGEHEVFPF
jgi:hypothetical protein